MTEFVLTMHKWKPGNAVQRYGYWTKGEPTVIIDMHKWNMLGKPKTVKVVLEDEGK